MAPGENRIPLSLLTDEDSIYLSFPKVFCGKRVQNRVKKVSPSNLAKSFARRKDRRCVTRSDVLFYLDRSLMLKKLASNVNIMLRQKSKGNGGAYSVNEMLNDEMVDSYLNEDRAYRVLNGVRSSSEYWKAQKKDVMAMIRQFGIPTLFVTLSAAETQWPELLVILKKVVDDVTITEDQAKEMAYAEKARLIQSDPVTCSRYFDYKFRELKKTWKDPNGPFAGYEISEYFFRIEFQHRGRLIKYINILACFI